MKTLVFILLCFICLIGCKNQDNNINSFASEQQTNNDSCTIRIPCKYKQVLANALRIIDSGEQYSKTVFDSLITQKHLDTTNEIEIKRQVYGMERKFAERYICEFDNSTARHNMPENDQDLDNNEYVGEVSFSQGEFSTLCALALTGQIQGVRAYLSKYKYVPADPDPQLRHHKRYSVILVGTTISNNMATDVLIPSTQQGSFLISVQNYGQPCKPNCPGAKLLPKHEGGENECQ
jgi:hypothetical protein